MDNTQIFEVKKHFEAGRTLTKMEATKKPFSTTNLGDIVLRLKAEPHNMKIDKEWRINLDSGRHFADYFLVRG